MANVTIYLQPELLAKVRQLSIPISATCQKALKHEIECARERQRVAEAVNRYNKPTSRRHT